MRELFLRTLVVFALLIFWLQHPLISSGAIEVEVYVDQSFIGDSNGSIVAPFATIEEGLTNLRPGETLVVREGIYVVEEVNVPVELSGVDEFHRTVIKSMDGETVIVTRADGYAPFVRFGANHSVLQGIWFIGKRDGNEPENAIHNGGSPIGYDKHFYNNMFVGYPGGIGEGTAEYYYYLENVFINCGEGYFSHPIYISGSNTPGQSPNHIYFVRNKVLFSQGWGVHLWHLPKNVAVLSNFLARNDEGIVDHGYGNVVANNMVWSTRWNSDENPRQSVGGWFVSLELEGITNGNIFGPRVRVPVWVDLEYNMFPFLPGNSLYIDPNNQQFGDQDIAISYDQLEVYLGFTKQKMETLLDEIERLSKGDAWRIYENRFELSSNLSQLDLMINTLPNDSPVGDLSAWYNLDNQAVKGVFGPSMTQPSLYEVWDVMKKMGIPNYTRQGRYEYRFPMILN